MSTNKVTDTHRDLKYYVITNILEQLSTS